MYTPKAVVVYADGAIEFVPLHEVILLEFSTAEYRGKLFTRNLAQNNINRTLVLSEGICAPYEA